MKRHSSSLLLSAVCCAAISANSTNASSNNRILANNHQQHQQHQMRHSTTGSGSSNGKSSSQLALEEKEARRLKMQAMLNEAKARRDAKAGGGGAQGQGQRSSPMAGPAASAPSPITAAAAAAFVAGASVPPRAASTPASTSAAFTEPSGGAQPSGGGSSTTESSSAAVRQSRFKIVVSAAASSAPPIKSSAVPTRQAAKGGGSHSPHSTPTVTKPSRHRQGESARGDVAGYTTARHNAASGRDGVAGGGSVVDAPAAAAAAAAAVPAPVAGGAPAATDDVEGSDFGGGDAAAANTDAHLAGSGVDDAPPSTATAMEEEVDPSSSSSRASNEDDPMTPVKDADAFAKSRIQNYLKKWMTDNPSLWQCNNNTNSNSSSAEDDACGDVSFASSSSLLFRPSYGSSDVSKAFVSFKNSSSSNSNNSSNSALTNTNTTSANARNGGNNSKNSSSSNSPVAWRTDVRVPVLRPNGTVMIAHGIGYASEEKTSQIIAAMHAERCLDEIGVQIFALPRMQQRYAETARAQGRFAPLPNDKQKPHDEDISFPFPLVHVSNLAPPPAAAGAVVGGKGQHQPQHQSFNHNMTMSQLLNRRNDRSTDYGDKDGSHHDPLHTSTTPKRYKGREGRRQQHNTNGSGSGGGDNNSNGGNGKLDPSAPSPMYSHLSNKQFTGTADYKARLEREKALRDQKRYAIHYTCDPFGRGMGLGGVTSGMSNAPPSTADASASASNDYMREIREGKLFADIQNEGGEDEDGPDDLSSSSSSFAGQRGGGGRNQHQQQQQQNGSTAGGKSSSARSVVDDDGSEVLEITLEGEDGEEEVISSARRNTTTNSSHQPLRGGAGTAARIGGVGGLNSKASSSSSSSNAAASGGGGGGSGVPGSGQQDRLLSELYGNEKVQSRHTDKVRLLDKLIDESEGGFFSIVDEQDYISPPNTTFLNLYFEPRAMMRVGGYVRSYKRIERAVQLEEAEEELKADGLVMEGEDDGYGGSSSAPADPNSSRGQSMPPDYANVEMDPEFSFLLNNTCTDAAGTATEALSAAAGSPSPFTTPDPSAAPPLTRRLDYFDKIAKKIGMPDISSSDFKSMVTVTESEAPYTVDVSLRTDVMTWYTATLAVPGINVAEATDSNSKNSSSSANAENEDGTAAPPNKPLTAADVGPKSVFAYQSFHLEKALGAAAGSGSSPAEMHYNTNPHGYSEEMLREKFPIRPSAWPHNVAIGRASTREKAIILCAMHAEALIDAFGLPLFPEDDAAQAEHSEDALSFGRWAIAPQQFRDEHPRYQQYLLESAAAASSSSSSSSSPQPPLLLLPSSHRKNLNPPKPLKEWRRVLKRCGQRSRHRASNLNADECYMQLNRLFITRHRMHLMEFGLIRDADDIHELNWCRELILQFIRDAPAEQMEYRRPSFVNFRYGAEVQIRTSILLPLPKQYGLRGGYAIGVSKEMAEGLAALHAVDSLCALCIPVSKDPAVQAELMALRRRKGRIVPQFDNPPHPMMRSPPGYRETQDTAGKPPLPSEIWRVMLHDTEQFDYVRYVGKYDATLWVPSAATVHPEFCPQKYLMPSPSGQFTIFRMPSQFATAREIPLVMLLKQIITNYFLANNIDDHGLHASEQIFPFGGRCSHYNGHQRRGVATALPANNYWTDVPVPARFGRRVAWGRCVSRKLSMQMTLVHFIRTLFALGLYPNERPDFLSPHVAHRAMNKSAMAATQAGEAARRGANGGSSGDSALNENDSTFTGANAASSSGARSGGFMPPVIAGHTLFPSPKDPLNSISTGVSNKTLFVGANGLTEREPVVQYDPLDVHVSLEAGKAPTPIRPKGMPTRGGGGGGGGADHESAAAGNTLSNVVLSSVSGGGNHKAIWGLSDWELWLSLPDGILADPRVPPPQTRSGGGGAGKSGGFNMGRPLGPAHAQTTTPDTTTGSSASAASSVGDSPSPSSASAELFEKAQRYEAEHGVKVTYADDDLANFPPTSSSEDSSSNQKRSGSSSNNNGFMGYQGVYNGKVFLRDGTVVDEERFPSAWAIRVHRETLAQMTGGYVPNAIPSPNPVSGSQNWDYVFGRMMNFSGGGISMGNGRRPLPPSK